MTQKKINGYIIFLKEILGQGSYGKVYRGQQDGTKMDCAVKVLEKKLIDQDEYLKSALFSEIQILQLVKSENIVKVLDVMESSHNYYIIQEICDNDLEKYIKQHGQLSEDHATDILRQICNGFMALVKEGIVHRDLKPANIMLNKGIVKIGDFGFAKKNITKRIKNATSVGTPLYMPIQILKSEPYTSKCDIWAVGFIFYELLHKQTPFTAQTEFELVRNIETKPIKINPNFCSNTQDFLQKCLKIDEQSRLGWDQVFLHPIFKGFFNQYAVQNQQFEDKLKMVMTELRFQINSKNIDLNKLLNSMGINHEQELTFTLFSDFLKYIHPGISKDQIKFFFEKMDTNEDGSISIHELSTEMEKHKISFSKNVAESLQNLTMIGNMLGVKKSESLEENFSVSQMSSELQIKVKKCFVKLYKILSSKKLTLYKTFSAYDTDKSGELGLEEFEKIMKRLDNTFKQDEIAGVFEFIDLDHSKTIEFEELNSYYCKVNGLSELIELPPDFFTNNAKKRF